MHYGAAYSQHYETASTYAPSYPLVHTGQVAGTPPPPPTGAAAIANQLKAIGPLNIPYWAWGTATLALLAVGYMWQEGFFDSEKSYEVYRQNFAESQAARRRAR